MVIFFIVTNPKVYCKACLEISAAQQNGMMSFPVTQHMEARQPAYLEACVKEGLRRWSPVVGLMSKEVPPGGAMILGKSVPGGARIGYSACGVQ